MPNVAIHLDRLDQGILDALIEDARRPAASIAAKVGLSPSAVRRRISRMEQLGVIAGYTVVLGQASIGPSVEAYVELKIATASDMKAVIAELARHPEVQEAAMLAGDPDALVRIRTQSVSQLSEVVGRIRARTPTTASKTLIALSRIQPTRPIRVS